MGRKVKGKKAAISTKSNRAASKSKPVKKPVAKKAAPKKLTKAAKVTRPVKSSIANAKIAAAPESSPTASRSPVHPVFRAGNAVTQVPTAKPAVVTEVALSLVAPVAKPELVPGRVSTEAGTEGKDVVAKKQVVLSPKVAWTALPKYLPAHIRFLLGMAVKECEQAQSSPFPLANLIRRFRRTFAVSNSQHCC